MTKEEAVHFFGTQAAIAGALGIGRAAVSEWSVIPIDRQCQIEVITEGALKADREKLKIKQET